MARFRVLWLRCGYTFIGLGFEAFVVRVSDICEVVRRGGPLGEGFEKGDQRVKGVVVKVVL